MKMQLRQVFAAAISAGLLVVALPRPVDAEPIDVVSTGDSTFLMPVAQTYSVPTGRDPSSIAITPSDIAYVANPDSDEVQVLDLSTRQLEAPIPAGSPLIGTESFTTGHTVADPVRNELWDISCQICGIEGYNPSDTTFPNAQIWIPGWGGQSSAIAVSSDGKYVVVAGFQGIAIASLNPEITIQSAPRDPTNLGGANITFTVSDPFVSWPASGIEPTTHFHASCTLDGEAPFQCLSSLSIAPLSEGQHRFSISFTDPSDSTGSDTFVWRIDMTPPVPNLIAHPPYTTASTSATFVVGINDSTAFAAGDTATCVVDDDQAHPVDCTTPNNVLTLNNLSVGTHTFDEAAHDIAGNVDINRFTWSITGPPLTTLSGGRSPGPVGSGYWLVDAAGEVYAFGSASPAVAARGPTVNIASSPSGHGYWVVHNDGTVYADGDAAVYGSPPILDGGESITSLSPTPSGKGYWLFTSLGRVFRYGDAAFFGDMSGHPLNGRVIGSVATSSGEGYFMVASDGGIFAFGDARFLGSMGGSHLSRPVVGLAPNPAGPGYWLVASDGGIFAFGPPFRGSMGGTPLNQPVVGMVAFGDGYLLVAADGGVFDFSSAPFAGSLGSTPPAWPIVGVAPVPGAA